MAQTDYISKQSVEILGPDDETFELVFEIGLMCTAPGFPGYFDPRVGGEPPSGPEFDISYISIDVPLFGSKLVDSKESRTLDLTYNQFAAIVGQDICDLLLSKAEDEATSTGEF